jgi:hypothetical protein
MQVKPVSARQQGFFTLYLRCRAGKAALIEQLGLGTGHGDGEELTLS